MNDPSPSLLERFARGDEDAADQLLQQHLPELRGFVRLRSGGALRGKESSSDLVQSVCREVLQHRERLQFPSDRAFKRWLYVTALRKIRNRREFYAAAKRNAGKEIHYDESGMGTLLGTYGSICTPSREVAALEQVRRIEDAFDQLPDDYREAITLARIVGLSRAEIAEEMGRSEGSVRMLLSRGTARLAELLGHG